MTPTQIVLAIVASMFMPTLAVLTGILVNNRQIDMLSRHFDSQFISFRNEIKADMQRMEGVLDARLTQVEQILKIR